MIRSMPQLRRRLSIAVWILALAVPVAGCSVPIPGQEEAVRLYTLNAAPATTGNAASTAAPIPWQITVEQPLTSAGLDTARIAVRRSGNAIEYLSRANWIDPVPSLVQGLLIETLENSGRFRAIGRDTVGLRPDYVVKPELRDFQAEIGSAGAGAVRVRMLVRVIRMPERSIVDSKVAEATAQTEGGSIDVIVAGFDVALQQVMAEQAAWVTGIIAAQRAPAAIK